MEQTMANPLLSLVIPALLYFSAGAFREIMCVFYYRAIGRKKDYAASGLAGGIEFYDLIVLSVIIRSGWSVPLMVAYTLGVMVGTFFSTRVCK
jgi:hypothetical protein